MKFQDKPLTIEDYKKVEKYIIKYKVSQTARSEGQIVDQMKKYETVDKLPIEWKNKRKLFLIRSIPAYIKKPTVRRWLSIKAWFFDQEPLDEDSKKIYNEVHPEKNREVGEPSN
jgi:hypothetical protein